MPSTTRFRRGDIVLVSFPFTDLTSTKRRPALGVSRDSFNDALQDVVLFALTTRLRPMNVSKSIRRNVPTDLAEAIRHQTD